MNVANIQFIYLSQLIGLPIIDLFKNKKVGNVVDVIATIEEKYPIVKGFTIKKKFSLTNYFIPIASIEKIRENKYIYVNDFKDYQKISAALSERDILLKETFWDKQIVNISGSKVERVNDLHLLRQNMNLWVVHIDIGFKGFLRRLGWFYFINNMSHWLFSAELKDQLIPWKYIQPISTTNIYGSLQLKMSYSKLQTLHPEDLADILLELGTDERIYIFQNISNTAAAKTLQELPPRIATQIIESLPMHHITGIVEELPIDEIVDIIQLMSLKTRNDILAMLPKDMILEINELLQHSHRVAGSILNTDYITAKENMTVSELLNKIKTEYIETESIYYAYVIDDSEKLIGVLTLRQLLAAEPDILIRNIMIRNVISVEIDDTIKNVAYEFFKYNFQTIPVVDEYDILQGVITLKDAFEEVFPEIRKEKEGIL